LFVEKEKKGDRTSGCKPRESRAKGERKSERGDKRGKTFRQGQGLKPQKGMTAQKKNKRAINKRDRGKRKFLGASEASLGTGGVGAIKYKGETQHTGTRGKGAKQRPEWATGENAFHQRKRENKQSDGGVWGGPAPAGGKKLGNW